MRKTLVLSGIKHCGKTTLGKLLAERQACAWYDLDQLVLNFPASSHYETVRELFRTEGVDHFRYLEVEAMKRVLTRFNPGTKSAVLSLGGGTIENKEAMDLIKNEATLVYLYSPEELLYTRIMDGGRPPFLSEENPKEDFHNLFIKRDGLNRDQADLVIDLPSGSAEENVQAIWNFLKKSE